MDLIERYVRDVSRRLPKRRRADTEGELRSAIMDEIEGRGAETEDEVVAVLREFGDPAAVAANYDPAGQYLIGPELFPAFRRVLAQSLAAVGALAILWLAVQLATGMAGPLSPGDALRNTIELAIRAAAGTVAGITATFYVLQRSGVAAQLSTREWDPRKLPLLHDADRVNRMEAAVSLVVLLAVMAFVGAIGGEARSGVDDAPAILRPLVRGALIAGIPFLLASMLVEVVMQAGLLLEGRRRVWTRALHVLSDGLAVVAFGIAAFSVSAERDALRAVGMPDAAILALTLTLGSVAAIIALSSIVREVRRSRNRGRAGAGHRCSVLSPAGTARR